LETLNQIKTTSSIDLLAYMGWKDEYAEEAKEAFLEFGYRFEEFILKTAEVCCFRWNYNEVVALDITKCTLARVWKYPTYNQTKSNPKDVNKGIKLWLGKIIMTQLANHHNKGTCYEPNKETDLSLIYTFDNFIEKASDSEDSRKIMKTKLAIVEEALSQLSEKHRIIYLTYKLYTHQGNNIPRCVNKKLQEELALVSGSIRKYKEQANKQVITYLNKING